MRLKSRTAEEEIARIAEAQHGVVTRSHLLGAGISAAGIWRRVRKGALLPEFWGVYRVGHRAPSTDAHYMAAILACGDGAVLSGRAAGYHLRLLKGAPPGPEVTAPAERRVKGIATRRARKLDSREITVYRGIPVTTAPRTLVDLAAVLDPPDLARAAHEAEVFHRMKPAAVDAVLARRPESPGARTLRRVLHGDIRVTLSKLESTFLSLLGAAELPLPITNRPAGGRRVDCRWPEDKLTVELDSYRYHNTRQAWEQDRRREREAHARGDDFRRYTYGDVCEEPGLMLAELTKLLLP